MMDNQYVEQAMVALEAIDIADGRVQFRIACQHLSQCLEHCSMPPEQYARAKALLDAKEALFINTDTSQTK
jgi:hypothetical protein